MEVKVGGSVVAEASTREKVKVIVAVHGVGDQYSFATIQSVVNQFCHFHHQPAAVPLGHFHTGKAPVSLTPPFRPGTFDHLAFAEVYWAKIPRDVVDEKHTMEEAKKWAGTLVERLRLSWNQSSTREGCRPQDFDRIKLILEEMIQTLAVIERICYLAERAGLFSFDLKKLLEDYLGDVQIVAEFDNERRKILDAFDATMTQVYAANQAAEIFIIAHSEGTVISFLGLLEAGRKADPPPWLSRVRGFMTLGSPIDKHLLLWPGLFPSGQPSPNLKLESKIQWRNYYDKGDPIGFELDGARAWNRANGWDRVFDFSKADDFSFVRYPFPGKAHVDYWNDHEVFGHFIATVIKDQPPDAGSAVASPVEQRKPPQTLQAKKWLSYVLPYVGVTAILMVGVFILYKAVLNATEPTTARNLRVMAHLIPGVTIMLLGVTVASRIPRLTHSPGWRVFAWALGLVLAVLALRIADGAHAPRFLNDFSDTHYMLGALALVVVVTAVSALRPALGLKPLILLGTSVIALVVGYWVLKQGSESGAVWPVFLATALFLYLWWLAALIFDLVFVWHSQIRSSREVRTMARLAGKPRAQCG
ncbi:MAG: hypothetical protein ABI836_04880 [Gemmatimonadota bacterium]